MALRGVMVWLSSLWVCKRLRRFGHLAGFFAFDLAILAKMMAVSADQTTSEDEVFMR